MIITLDAIVASIKCKRYQCGKQATFAASFKSVEETDFPLTHTGEVNTTRLTHVPLWWEMLLLLFSFLDEELAWCKLQKS